MKVEFDSSLYRNYYRQAYQYPIKKYEKACKIIYKTESRDKIYRTDGRNVDFSHWGKNLSEFCVFISDMTLIISRYILNF